VVKAQVQQLAQMKRRPSQPSRRLLAAAAAERTEIAKQRDALAARRRTLSAQIDDIDAELAELAERAALIDQLAGPTDSDNCVSEDEKRSATDDRIVLRGPAIRHTAVTVLLAARCKSDRRDLPGADQRTGDRVIALIVNVRRLLRGESDRPRPSQWRLACATRPAPARALSGSSGRVVVDGLLLRLPASRARDREVLGSVRTLDV
jgi:hypothetical protein